MNYLIILVEDHKELSEAICIRLEKAGYNVIPCYDGDSAYETINENKPKLVILDINIPGIYGFDLLGRIRNTPGLETTKFIIMTGTTKEYGDDTPDEEWKKLTGVEAFIAKPFDSKILMAQINKIMK